MELDASGVFQLTMAAVGIPVLVLLWRRRGSASDPVPEGEPPIEPTGLLGPGACLIAWMMAIITLLSFGVLGEEASLPMRLGGMSVAHAIALITGYAAIRMSPNLVRWKPAARGPSLRAGVLAALAFLPVGLAVHLAANLIQSEVFGVDPPAQGLIQEAISGDRMLFLTVAGFGIVAAPLLEETFFRGFLYAGLRRHASPWVAAVLSAVTFAAMHIEPTNLAVVPPLIAMGLFLAYLRERTGGLIAPIAMHTVYNSVQMVGVALLADQAI